MKQKLTLSFLALIFSGLTALCYGQVANQVTPPIRGVGVVVKKQPGSGASKLVPTNDDGETGVIIISKGNYILTLPKNILKDKKTQIAIGVCSNKQGIIEKYYTANQNGEVALSSIEAGIYYLKLIRKPIGTCPEGYKIENGVCVVETTIVNGKQVIGICYKGKIECYIHVNGGSGVEQTTDPKICPESGTSCDWKGVKIKDVKYLILTPVGEDENSSPNSTKGNKGGTTKGNNGFDVQLGAGVQLISQTDCTGYWNGTNCSGSSGICCLKEIIVTPKFDLLAFDKLVTENNHIKIREIFKKDLKSIGLENFLSLESGQKIVDAIVSGELVFEKTKSESEKYGYLIKNVVSNKSSYNGHVTLLCRNCSGNDGKGK